MAEEDKAYKDCVRKCKKPKALSYDDYDKWREAAIQEMAYDECVMRCDFRGPGYYWTFDTGLKYPSMAGF